MLYVGLFLFALGILLFMIPMVFNKWERLVAVGFIVFCVGCFVSIAGAIMKAMA